MEESSSSEEDVSSTTNVSTCKNQSTPPGNVEDLSFLWGDWDSPDVEYTTPPSGEVRETPRGGVGESPQLPTWVPKQDEEGKLAFQLADKLPGCPTARSHHYTTARSTYRDFW